ncbi:MAG: bifunctional biotin--[acetyl-CoA-carboxylase] ligase/biotin operon repressor BirA [Methylotenera sp.]|nr:bifunctional biotin--[acetyl-CoA-carboxylase] ligase/biotin operon repressor BirA [Methylotenera sp.]
MNTLTFPILKLLCDGKFHSGEAIAKYFNVSRTHVWNALQDAEELGVEIFAVRGRGYQLPNATTLLNPQTVRACFESPPHWLQLEVHDFLPSTNSYLMHHMSTCTHGTCVAANLQTQGRGRRGRQWQAGLGASLTFSLLWRFQCGASALSGLSLAVGVALIRALHALGFVQAKLKWPNDVLVDSKKLAGILIELQGDAEGPTAAVIGIGINLHLPHHLKQQIDQPATDLTSMHGQAVNPNTLLATLLIHLKTVLETFETEGFSALHDEWSKHHAYHAKTVKMLMPDGREIQGLVQSVAEDGSLLINTDHGLQRFVSGEISLRVLEK